MSNATKLVLTTKICTITGHGTFTAKDKLKDEKFKFDPAAKSWSREVGVDDNGAIYYGEFFQGSVKGYQHHWDTYAKGKDIVIELA